MSIALILMAFWAYCICDTAGVDQATCVAARLDGSGVVHEVCICNLWVSDYESTISY